MTHPRLSLALAAGGLAFGDGRVAVFGPRADVNLRDLPQARCQLITGFKPDVDLFEQQGWDVAVAPEGAFTAAVVFLPRAKKLAKAMIHSAVALSAGPVVIDGAKNEGVDSLLKDLRKRGVVENVISKAHGKLFWITGFSAEDLADWQAPERQEIDEGFVTAPGVFSADGVDPASRLLVSALPDKLGKHVADLGAGWGYLARNILTREKVKTLALVESDHAAITCAQVNVRDDRATFHWADATAWRSERLLDAVIMNPPFHTGRAAEPQLGQAFIATAARNLAQSGQLWMVANRHLPYETTLAERFLDVKEIAGDNRFKVLHAARPRRSGR